MAPLNDSKQGSIVARPDDEPKQQEIAAQLDTLFANIGYLEIAIEELENNLRPVLRNEPTATTEDPGRVVPQTLFGESLQAANSRLSNVLSTTHSIRYRSEL